MEIVVIGGGASGLIGAIAAARRGKKVVILEHKDKIGKKILATGNGKCNYTNLVQRPECYRGDNPAYAMEVLKKFGVKDTVSFFRELGIYPKDKAGYLYPNSEQAASLLEVLRLELEHLEVEMECGQHVVGIEKKKKSFLIKTTDRVFEGKKVLLAAGGMASPELGSDGSGYLLAAMLGHRVITPVPALVQLKAQGSYFKTLAGIRTEAEVTLYIDGIKSGKSTGELQLTAYGVSGIPIFEISRFAAKALEGKKEVILYVDFFRDLKEDEVILLLKERIAQCSYKTIEYIFLGLLNKKLSYVLIKEAGIPVETPAVNITEKEIQKLAAQIKRWRVTIQETNSFTNAQVTAGGVATEEVDPDTMESKLVEGLYLTGELLDIDGTCGGYNLQWAWSTGYIAGTHSGKL